jgi:hypothetical protein
MIDFLVARTIMSLKFANNAFLNFKLMINFLAASAIMRSKLFKFAKLHLWLILALIINHLCIKTFDLMIDLLFARKIMRLKCANNAFFEFRSHD